MSTLVLICLFILIRSYPVHIGLIWYILVHFVLFCPSIRLKAPILNLKSLSIAFNIATLLLSYINVVFQSTLVRLNLSESVSKHEGYEYTNLIFRVVTHLF